MMTFGSRALISRLQHHIMSAGQDKVIHCPER
jgi:hypothetical protein